MSVEERLAAALGTAMTATKRWAPSGWHSAVNDPYWEPAELATAVIRALADSGVVLIEREAIETVDRLVSAMVDRLNEGRHVPVEDLGSVLDAVAALQEPA